MKLLHTSDWHLGMTFRGGTSYAEDQKYAIENICRIAVTEKVDGILLAGDIFRIDTDEDLYVFFDALQHRDFIVRGEAGQHAGGVHIVKKLAAHL